MAAANTPDLDAERQLIEEPRAGRRVVASGLGTRMFGAGDKPASVKMVDEGSNDRQGADATAFAQAG